MDPLEPGVGDLPPSLAETEDGERLITWIRVRAPEGAARLSGLWVNGVEVAQRAWVPAENLPTGTGEPGQRAIVVNTPVLPETAVLAVNGDVWQRVDDLFAAGSEIPQSAPRLAETSTPSTATATSKAYALDAESGEIRFGDGFTGMRPPRGATIVVSYAYGGGQQGVVGIGAINKGPTLPAGIQVTNPAPTWGGSDAETVADAEFRIPRWLRHRDRLVTEEDFREIAWATPGVVLGRVEVLPHPFAHRVSEEFDHRLDRAVLEGLVGRGHGRTEFEPGRLEPGVRCALARAVDADQRLEEVRVGQLARLRPELADGSRVLESVPDLVLVLRAHPRQH
jgi:predicted phage baseplate assembly protein